MSAPELTGSVSVMIGAMKGGNEAAVTGLFQRYFGELTRFARRRLNRSVCGACAGDDVAIEAFEKIYFAARSGRLKKVNNRGELWRLLVVMASRRAAEVCRSEQRLKRGGKSRQRMPLEEIESVAPAVDVKLLLVEQREYLLGILHDDTLREVATRRLDGDSLADIARRRGFCREPWRASWP